MQRLEWFMGASNDPGNAPTMGWLAAFTCCWTAHHGTEECETVQAAPARLGTCLEQPTPLTALPAFPTRNIESSSSSQITVDIAGQDSTQALIQTTIERPPLLKPLDFGDNSFFVKSPQKPTIGTPIDFRRVSLTEGQRNSLIPLKLGPVVLKDPSELSTPRSSLLLLGGTPAKSSDDLLTTADQGPSTALHSPRSEPSIRSLSLLKSGISSATHPSSSTGELRLPKQTLSAQSSCSSMRSLRRRTMEASASSLSIPSFDKHWLKRRRSNQSVGKSNYEIDREILELNTIVEERRAEAARSVSPSDHVPAVAPSMPVRARSKTLTDIGSAFSKPVTSVSATSARLSRPFMPDLFGPEVVDPIVRPATAHATSGTKARVSGWFSGLLRTQPSGPLPSNEPFYKCNSAALHHTNSTSSLCTLVTDIESPCPTATSSPASKSHTRTLTLESRNTSVSTPTIMKDHAECNGKKDEKNNWPLVIDDDESEVGVAF